MAIKKKAVAASAVELPRNIDQLSLKAFTEQFLTKKYEDTFKETKGELLAAIEVSDLELTMGESFKTKYGTILINETTRKKVDNDKLIDLVMSKKISIEQVLACVSTFNNEELEKTLSTPVFNKIVTPSTTQSTTLKANAEFKKKCEEEFELGGIVPVDVPRELSKMKDEIKEVKKEVKEKLSSRDKLKKAISKVKDVEDDLDSILNS